jgi:hypothetical protein
MEMKAWWRRRESNPNHSLEITLGYSDTSRTDSEHSRYTKLRCDKSLSKPKLRNTTDFARFPHTSEISEHFLLCFCGTFGACCRSAIANDLPRMLSEHA